MKYPAGSARKSSVRKKASTMWKGILIRAAERMRLTSPSRRQSFIIRSFCEIENTQIYEQAFSVVIPIPQNTPFQIFHKKIEWTCAEVEMQKEEAFGNVFAVWKGKLAAKSKKQCRYTVHVRITPIASASPRDFTDCSFYEARNEPDVRCVSPSDSRVQEISRGLFLGKPGASAYMRRAYEYVIRHLNYGSPIQGLYTVHDALTRKEVDCGGFSTLLSSILLRGGIQARVVSGFFAPSFGIDSMHAWVEACIAPDKWMPLDPSADYLFRQGRALRRSGRFGFVGSDHVAYSYGCDLSLIFDGRQYTAPFLQHPFFISPQPLEGLVISSNVDIAKL